MSENTGGLIARAKLWPWAVIARVAAVLTGALLAYLVYLWIFVVPEKARHDAAQSHQDARVATGTLNVAQGASNALEAREAHDTVTREIIKENTREILSAPGAGQDEPAAVHDAFVRGVERLRNQADQH